MSEWMYVIEYDWVSLRTSELMNEGVYCIGEWVREWISECVDKIEWGCVYEGVSAWRSIRGIVSLSEWKSGWTMRSEHMDEIVYQLAYEWVYIWLNEYLYEWEDVTYEWEIATNWVIESKVGECMRKFMKK